MRILQRVGLAALAAVGLMGLGQRAEAGVGIAVGFGGGYCYRPAYRVGFGFYFPGYYPAYPVYVAPPPVVVQPAPVVVQPGYPTPSPAPAPEKLPTPTPGATATTAEPPYATAVSAPSPDSPLGRLHGTDAQDRAAAAMELGRARDRQAVQPLTKVLREDSSPAVREATARALGLIADPASLSALQYAAQADDDREVRHSAQFAAEVIRGSLKR